MLSKGHAATALYAALAVRGDLDGEDMVARYMTDGSAYAGHAEHHVPGVEATTGSLGHGLSLALGMALSDRIDGGDRRTFCLLGDGELGEGSVWEAVALAGHLRLGTLSAIIDANGLQGLGRVEDIAVARLARRALRVAWLDRRRRRRARLRRAGGVAAPRRRPPALRDRPHHQGAWHPLARGHRDVALPLLPRRGRRCDPGRARGGRVRDAFVRALTRIAIEDDRVVVLTADLGIGLFDEIAASAPSRFLNVGIAEQNMIGIAAGMALAGRRVFVYSIAPFVTSRPHDQLRVDVAYHRADVTIVGVGGGVAYGALGPTHHAIEDLALMRALPNMTVVAPGSPSEAAAATQVLADHHGPSYLRLAKNGEPECLPDEPFRLGVARTLRRGSAATICSTGALLPHALAAADRLTGMGHETGVLHVPTVKPLDVGAIAAALRTAPLLVTLEDHTLAGGFGSAVAEVVVDHGLRGNVLRLGIPDCFAPVVGSREHLLELYGLSTGGIVAAIDTRLCARIAA